MAALDTDSYFGIAYGTCNIPIPIRVLVKLCCNFDFQLLTEIPICKFFRLFVTD